MSELSFDAMRFAFEKHKGQKRKYIGNPYTDHLAEVAGIYAAGWGHYRKCIAICWLHDVIEDTDCTYDEIHIRFDRTVADGVFTLSDLEKGNRETRKRLSRERLARAPAYIQDIKVCDLISNTSSIVGHDPDFAKVYLKEKEMLLDVLTKANSQLVAIARSFISGND